MEYNPNDVDLFFGGQRIEGFAPEGVTIVNMPRKCNKGIFAAPYGKPKQRHQALVLKLPNGCNYVNIGGRWHYNGNQTERGLFFHADATGFWTDENFASILKRSLRNDHKGYESSYLMELYLSNSKKKFKAAQSIKVWYY